LQNRDKDLTIIKAYSSNNRQKKHLVAKVVEVERTIKKNETLQYEQMN
jgi:hypothetical protein